MSHDKTQNEESQQDEQNFGTSGQSTQEPAEGAVHPGENSQEPPVGQSTTLPTEG